MADTLVLCDVRFEVVSAVQADTGRGGVVVYVTLPDVDGTRFGALLTPDEAAGLAGALSAAAGVPPAAVVPVGVT